MCPMNTPPRHSASLTLLILGPLFLSGCTAPKGGDGEIEPPVINSEHAAPAPKEIVVHGTHSRDAAIHDLVAEAQIRLRDVELQYIFTGTGKNQVLRRRPVAFALWSEAVGVHCAHRAAASADQVETGWEALGLSHSHPGYSGAARGGHRCRAV